MFGELTINHSNEMTFLVLCTAHIRNHTNKLIDHDLMHFSSNVDIKILTFVAEELPIATDDSNLLWQPIGRTPQLPSFIRLHICIDRQDGRYRLHLLALRHLLVSAASRAPASRWFLSLNACLQDLRECLTRSLRVRGASVACTSHSPRWIDELVALHVLRSCHFVHALATLHCGQHLRAQCLV